MSRVGKLPIPVPGTVTVSLAEGIFTAKGPKGELTVAVPEDMSVEIGEGEVSVTRPSDSKQHKSLHGLARSLMNSAVVGVSEGFMKRLQIIGVGWNAKLQGKQLQLNVGYCQPRMMAVPDILDVGVENDMITMGMWSPFVMIL